jgi:hypothetical protein
MTDFILPPNGEILQMLFLSVLSFYQSIAEYTLEGSGKIEQLFKSILPMRQGYYTSTEGASENTEANDMKKKKGATEYR